MMALPDLMQIFYLFWVFFFPVIGFVWSVQIAFNWLLRKL
jgi:hypothetical protein